VDRKVGETVGVNLKGGGKLVKWIEKWGTEKLGTSFRRRPESGGKLSKLKS
jgi:hypothetical protein